MSEKVILLQKKKLQKNVFQMPIFFYKTCYLHAHWLYTKLFQTKIVPFGFRN